MSTSTAQSGALLQKTPGPDTFAASSSIPIDSFMGNPFKWRHYESEIIMYAMVNVPGNAVNNLNQVYMAGLMAAPMIVIELVLMRMMYPDKKRNRLIMAASVIALLAFFVFIRQQTAIGDKQFLRSMIPHHAGAITMCEEAAITEPEIQELCETIVSSQQAEIDQMRALLEEQLE